MEGVGQGDNFNPPEEQSEARQEEIGDAPEGDDVPVAPAADPIAQQMAALLRQMADFLREFKKKNVPSTYVDARIEEFLQLKQDHRTVAEYEREFTRLSYYAGSMLVTGRDRCKGFEQGLKPIIKSHVIGFEHENFFALVSQALNQEKVEQEKAIEKEKSVCQEDFPRG
ncbi:uncharacterized protein LOC119370928 [Jatropha curcas]|uniref:uncharacterized protein LOC119370928 n=1 Tax=Jatropha curcas TaxID=180498 RepID=UPI00189489A6|nr:uncharacterized protein LOC119370928 [Jatropha curcas]